MDGEMDLSEQRGMNHVLWDWGVSWKPFTEEVGVRFDQTVATNDYIKFKPLGYNIRYHREKEDGLARSSLEEIHV